jgi:transcriptional antiterminator NusG
VAEGLDAAVGVDSADDVDTSADDACTTSASSMTPPSRPQSRRPTRTATASTSSTRKFGDWYVMHSYAGYGEPGEANLETRITSLNMEDYIFEIRSSRPKRSSRSATGPAQDSSPAPDARLRPGAHGPHRRVVGRRAPDPLGHRVRRQRAASPSRCRSTRSSMLKPADLERRRTPRRLRRGSGHEEAEIEVVDFEVGESVMVMEGPFRDPARHDLRDQPRHPEAQGAGRDLRAGDPGRPHVLPGRQDCLSPGSCGLPRGPSAPGSSPRRRSPPPPARTQHASQEEGSGAHQGCR